MRDLWKDPKNPYKYWEPCGWKPDEREEEQLSRSYRLWVKVRRLQWKLVALMLAFAPRVLAGGEHRRSRPDAFAGPESGETDQRTRSRTRRLSTIHCHAAESWKSCAAVKSERTSATPSARTQGNSPAAWARPLLSPSQTAHAAAPLPPPIP
jgi:hypothetical protein